MKHTTQQQQQQLAVRNLRRAARNIERSDDGTTECRRKFAALLHVLANYEEFGDCYKPQVTSYLRAFAGLLQE